MTELFITLCGIVVISAAVLLGGAAEYITGEIRARRRAKSVRGRIRRSLARVRAHTAERVHPAGKEAPQCQSTPKSAPTSPRRASA